tara:strand:+ start:75 stop:1115 length:1041 start_codon:yes stop_codon:yes gene_type:complete
MPENNKYDIINGNNFAKFSNIIFSEELITDEFEKKYKNNSDIQIIKEVSNDRASFIFYILKNFTVKENDVIFCNTNVVEILFKSLKSIKNLKNLKLVTHQSDRPVDKSLFNKKPSSISRWYSINVDHDDENLISIPLGVNDSKFSNYMNEDIISKFFSRIPSTQNKIDKLYMNFNPNTNRKEREKIYNDLYEKDWCVADEPNKTAEEYYNNIKDYKYVLAPWGNGIDTFRLWESLYLGSIPVTKYHRTYKSFSDFPIMFVESYDDINLDQIQHNQKLPTDKLNIHYWMNLINQKKIESSEEELILGKNYGLNKHLIFFNLNSLFSSRLKKIRYFFNRALKKVKISK